MMKPLPDETQQKPMQGESHQRKCLDWNSLTHPESETPLRHWHLPLLAHQGWDYQQQKVPPPCRVVLHSRYQPGFTQLLHGAVNSSATRHCLCPGVSRYSSHPCNMSSPLCFISGGESPSKYKEPGKTVIQETTLSLLKIPSVTIHQLPQVKDVQARSLPS